MDHEEALRTGAVERYVLGDLSESEREEFELHFFDCSECGEDLRVAALFEENAKAVFKEKRAVAVPQVKAGFWPVLWRFAPAGAAFALLVAVAYQSMVVIPRLNRQLHLALAPQPVDSYVLPPLSRGDAPVLKVRKDAQFYAIYADPTWESSFPAYECSVHDDGWAERFRVQLPSPPPGKPIQILLARTALPSGRYTVIIRNMAQTELARYRLVLELE